ncbi:FG-GAP repeat protein [Streptomyces sp. Amel2xB2]|uniref:FG-GAP and VCBS repeat-containing protein n=1 Tax=Streptomyces sp. Amel2xB2 TaxID=1305829 RepID=UPI000DBF4BE0|nr:FG-GAP repeat protein [Streptomyces sp. Amel2xB2]RAJ66671.1 FG-GAP repeat protein [Streptomyces sp. Amel2xB2]
MNPVQPAPPVDGHTRHPGRRRPNGSLRETQPPHPDLRRRRSRRRGHRRVRVPVHRHRHRTATSDFDGDGRDDLIAGAPGEAIGSRAGAGAAWLLHGGARGLLDADGTATSVTWNQDTSGVPGVAEANDAFGTAVAAGDYNADGVPDVTAGSPGENASLGAAWLLPSGSSRNVTAFSPRTLGLPYPSTAQKYGNPLTSR